MIAARQRFLDQGHFAAIARALCSLATQFAPAGEPGIVLDLAGGTGYYLSAVLAGLPERAGVCLDTSKPALRRAARAHPRAAAVGCDVWRALPVADRSAAVVLSVFGPRNTAETIRVLTPAGVFLLVTPTPSHLREVIADLSMLGVDPDKPRRLAASLASLDLLTARTLTYEVALGHRDLADLVAMGPSAYHVDPAELERRIAEIPGPRPVTVSVRLAAYHPRQVIP